MSKRRRKSEPAQDALRDALEPLSSPQWLTEARRKAIHLSFIVLPLELLLEVLPWPRTHKEFRLLFLALTAGAIAVDVLRIHERRVRTFFKQFFGEMIRAMTKVGGEFPGILPPVMSGFRTNALHPLASRKRIQMGDRVNIDLCGVYNRYHANLARGFWVGEPPAEVVEFHDKSIGVFGIIKEKLRPGLNVVEFLEALRDYYRSVGIWDENYWSGGYEFGIAFPPDWVGAFIYDLSISGPEDVFRPMTAVNHECNFFAPLKSGLSATIDTFLFYEDGAKILSHLPREIQVLHA